MADPQITLENVSVHIPIYSAPQHHSMKQRAMNISTGGRIATGSKSIPYIVALDSISLDMPSGSRLGLVGHNGAGKTTLLRTIAGILKPTGGRVYLQGRPSIFINPSLGMNPEITGREFIEIQSYISGVSRSEIKAKMQSIVEFTELNEFIDLPIRTYSAGMQTRLSFAVATAYEAEIVLLDEGLGTGDATFQEKATKRLETWLGQAGIVVLASHSNELVNSICDRVVELDHGKILQSKRI